MADLADGVAVRSARVEDAAAIAALMAAVDLADGLEPWATEADVREDLTGPDLQLETDTWVVEEGNHMVGYGELWNLREEEADALDAQCYTAPTHVGMGIGSFLIDRTEKAAEEAAPRLPRRPLLLRNFVWAKHDSSRGMLEARGYRCVRHFFHMAIALDDLGHPPRCRTVWRFAPSSPTEMPGRFIG